MHSDVYIVTKIYKSNRYKDEKTKLQNQSKKNKASSTINKKNPPVNINHFLSGSQASTLYRPFSG